MMTLHTRMSFLDTANDMDTNLLAQTVKESHELLAQMLDPEAELVPSPVAYMWMDYEVALAAYCAAMSLELETRGVMTHKHFEARKLVEQLRRIEPAEFVRPPWIEDVDFLRSHRSNMTRRWPDVYGEMWKGTPELMPYLWPMIQDDGSYTLTMSKHDKALLATGERVLPTSIKKRVANL